MEKRLDRKSDRRTAKADGTAGHGAPEVDGDAERFGDEPVEEGKVEAEEE